MLQRFDKKILVMKLLVIISLRYYMLVTTLMLVFSSMARAEETHSYVGAVGSQAAVFKLAWYEDGGLSGSYFCPGGSGKVYSLVGSNQVAGEIILKEYTPGRAKATATCKLKKNIENGKIVWRGVMVNHDGRTKEMFFYRDRN
jgi:hypothetical protein